MSFEIADHLVVVCWGYQLLKLVQNVNAAPRIIRILRIFEVLNLHEQVKELIEALDYIDINFEEGLERLVALRIFIHSCVMNRIPSHYAVLLS